MATQKPVSNLSFEEALGELETIVRGLEKGDIGLEDSIKAYERGNELRAHCETRLRDAQMKIEKISVGKDGKLKTQPLDTED